MCADTHCILCRVHYMLLLQAKIGKDWVKPAGFIFHETRCGSTLIANQLAVLPSNRVFSESKVAIQVRPISCCCDIS
jgi:hypothetical protein